MQPALAHERQWEICWWVFEDLAFQIKRQSPCTSLLTCNADVSTWYLELCQSWDNKHRTKKPARKKGRSWIVGRVWENSGNSNLWASSVNNRQSYSSASAFWYLQTHAPQLICSSPAPLPGPSLLSSLCPRAQWIIPTPFLSCKPKFQCHHWSLPLLPQFCWISSGTVDSASFLHFHVCCCIAGSSSVLSWSNSKPFYLPRASTLFFPAIYFHSCLFKI